MYATGEERYVLVTKMVPWTKSELKAASDEQKAIMASSKKEQEDKSSDDNKSGEAGFVDNIKLGYEILKGALSNLT